MLSKRHYVLLLLVIFTLSLYGQSADEIIQKNIEARGGYDAIKSIKSFKVVGKSLFGNMEFSFKRYIKKPDCYRSESYFGDRVMITGSNGDTTWSNMPNRSGRMVRSMGQSRRRGFMAGIPELEGPLVDYKEKGHTVELVGRENMQGTEVFKLKVNLKDGNTKYYYIDTEYYLVLKEESLRRFQDREFVNETYYSDYKEVDGLLIPHSIEIKRGGMQRARGGRFGGSFQIVIEKIEINPELDPSIFEPPKG